MVGQYTLHAVIWGATVHNMHVLCSDSPLLLSQCHNVTLHVVNHSVCLCFKENVRYFPLNITAVWIMVNDYKFSNFVSTFRHHQKFCGIKKNHNFHVASAKIWPKVSDSIATGDYHRVWMPG